MTAIAIVGSGPSAIYTLKGLLDCQYKLQITIFEVSSNFGFGWPYDPATTDPSMLANIASVEIPPVDETLIAFLSRQSDAKLHELGVERGAIEDRNFFPRVALGAYFSAQIQRLRAHAQAHGHSVAFLSNCRVEDIIGHTSHVTVMTSDAVRGTISSDFDFVVIASGHRSARPTNDHVARAPYPAPTVKRKAGLRVGILGASLSAIDIAVSISRQLGEFVSTADGLEFSCFEDAAGSTIHLMSRRGLLPEADFYCPIPYESLRYCTAEHLLATAATDQFGLLDRAFELFRRELLEADALYASEIDLASATADDFAERYFAPRVHADPFEWASKNLHEAQANYRDRRTVAWRYVILRMHESVGAIVPLFSERDLKRFANGLQRVFIDNYAAVPHLSIERLLALHRAGVLDIVQLPPDYEVDAGSAGEASIRSNDGSRQFDLLVDARGQSALPAQEMPFPTLRMQTGLNAMFPNGAANANIGHPRELSVDETFRFAPGAQPIHRIYCIAVPFLLSRYPFCQGIKSASELSAVVTRSLIAAVAAGNDNLPGPTEECSTIPDRRSDRPAFAPSSPSGP